MAYFAKIGPDGTGLGVVKVDDSDCPTESDGVEFLTKLTGHSDWRESTKAGSIPKSKIKDEAERRILAIMPEYKQRNTLAAGLAAMLEHGPDPQNWPSDLQQQHADAMTAWAEIERLREKSNEIEAMDPIPADFRDDTYWTEVPQ